LIVSACSSSRAIQNGSQPCPASKVPTRKDGVAVHHALPITAAILRMPHQGCAAERCSHKLSQVSLFASNAAPDRRLKSNRLAEIKSRLNSRTQSAIPLGGVVDCQGQRAAHPDIVEQLPLVVQGDQASAAPITFLNGQLATESGSKLVALFLAENYGTRAARSLQIAPTRVDRLSAKIPVKPSR
jgi:hypothetical protein